MSAIGMADKLRRAETLEDVAGRVTEADGNHFHAASLPMALGPGCPSKNNLWPSWAAPTISHMAKFNRISTEESPGLGQTPFATLSSDGLPPAPASLPMSITPQPKLARKNRGRVDILRVKAGRGGKTVTVVKNFVGIGLPEKEQLAKAMQRACGTGGTVKNGQIEIQGDNREAVARILIEANFQPVFAGG